MGYQWTVLIGAAILFGMMGGVFFYLLKSALHTSDSTRIDSPAASDKKHIP
ncbi:hypothetical protein [Peribacillus kribbensis]|uniref:hypothetical protein n=1 Tax=Peribacillus kribbensis TaxID=356658 RepID=UPI000428E7EE|nr:hypothetical protein [Peribacillus kribbensis]